MTLHPDGSQDHGVQLQEQRHFIPKQGPLLQVLPPAASSLGPGAPWGRKELGARTFLGTAPAPPPLLEFSSPTFFTRPPFSDERSIPALGFLEALHL